jgi:hypothetical protein
MMGGIDHEASLYMRARVDDILQPTKISSQTLLAFAAV